MAPRDGERRVCHVAPRDGEQGMPAFFVSPTRPPMAAPIVCDAAPISPEEPGVSAVSNEPSEKRK